MRKSLASLAALTVAMTLAQSAPSFAHTTRQVQRYYWTLSGPPAYRSTYTICHGSCGGSNYASKRHVAQ